MMATCFSGLIEYQKKLQSFSNKVVTVIDCADGLTSKGWFFKSRRDIDMFPSVSV